MLSREGCPFCAEAKQMLSDPGYDRVDVQLPHTVRSRALGAIANAQTVPQVFINGELVGGSEELERCLQRKKAA